MEKKVVTLEDIAERLGTTKNTVSRALRDCSDIGAATKERVKQTAMEMGYVPNRIAGFLRSKRSNIIAVVVNSLTNPFYSICMDHCTDYMGEKGYRPLISIIRKDVDVGEIISCVQNGACGILSFLDVTDDAIDYCEQNKIPFLICGFKPHSDRVSALYSDEYQCARLVAQEAIVCGAKHPCFVDLAKNNAGAMRREGFAATLKGAGLGCDIYTYNYYSKEASIQKIRQSVEANGNDFIFCFNDEIAAAVQEMTESLLGEEGLQLRIFRTSTEFALFAWNGTEWTHLGSIDISSYGEIPARIVLYGAQASYVWSDIGIQTLTHVAASEPSAEKPGNHAYYTDGTRYWFEDFEETTAEDVMIYMPVSVTLNLSAIALDGKTAAQIPEGTVITLTGRSNVYTYTVGESDVLNMIAGSYTVSADGYRTIQLTVPAAGGELNVALTQVIALQGSVEDYTSKKWSDSATLEIGQNIADSTAVILEFTIKNVTNSQAGWLTEEWASQRLAIQMAAGNEGFLFFLPKGEANIFDMTDNTISDSGKTRFGESGAIYAWIDTLMRTENGVQMRLVRTGENVTLYVLNESAQWVKIGTVACADAQTEIIFYGCGVTWEFSSVTVDELTYVAEKQPTASEQGNVAYYTDGTNYWFEDGSQTTAEDVVINAVSVSLSFSATELDASKPASLADGTVITLTGKFNTYTYTVGGAALTQMYADTYTVTADGYATATLVVPEEGGELTVTMHKALTIGKGAVALTNNAWAGQEKLTVPDGLTTGDFVFEATLNMRDFLSGWDTIQTQQRYAIRLTEGNVGFYFWSWNSGGTRTHIRQFGENNLTNAMAENADVNGDEAGLGYIVDELLSDEGLRIRITRTGTTFKLEVMNGDAWAELGSVTCAEGDAADIELYAGAGTYVWSNITINPV